jgi:hypothetical protein
VFAWRPLPTGIGRPAAASRVVTASLSPAGILRGAAFALLEVLKHIAHRLARALAAALAAPGATATAAALAAGLLFDRLVAATTVIAAARGTLLSEGGIAEREARRDERHA